MTDSESDVSKALAAFGAPSLKYRSFSHAPIKVPDTLLGEVAPGTPPASPIAGDVSVASGGLMPAPPLPVAPTGASVSVPEITAPDLSSAPALPSPPAEAVYSPPVYAPVYSSTPERPVYAAPMQAPPPGTSLGHIPSVAGHDIPLPELFRILSAGGAQAGLHNVSRGS